MTRENWINVGALALFIVAGFWAVSSVSTPREPEERYPAPPKRCRILPTGIVNYGTHVESTKDGLYICWQEGAPGDADMTQIWCVPMGECVR